MSVNVNVAADRVERVMGELEVATVVVPSLVNARSLVEGSPFYGDLDVAVRAGRVGSRVRLELVRVTLHRMRRWGRLDARGMSSLVALVDSDVLLAAQGVVPVCRSSCMSC